MPRTLTFFLTLLVSLIAGISSGRTTTHAYDLGGKVTRKALPNNNATTTTRDKLGRTLFMVERASSLAVVAGVSSIRVKQGLFLIF